MGQITFSNKRSTPLVIAGVAFLVGVALARWLTINYLILLLLPVVFLLPGRIYPLLLVTYCAVVFGLWRGHQYMVRLAAYQALFRQPVTLTAQANDDAIYAKQSQLSFDVGHIVVEQPKRQLLVGTVKVEGFGATMVYRGDTVQIQGSMSPTKGAAQAKISFGKIKVVRRSHSLTDSLRRRFVAGLQSVLPEPEAPFAAGLLIGQRSTIPADINNQLSATGLTHLVAVSGYNLTIIIMAARRLLGRRSKFQSTVVAAGLIVTFVMVTGLSASIVRAALVSGLSLLAWYYGRQFQPLLLIVAAAAMTVFWSPFYLWSDIGWYLSFLAFFGVLVAGPLLQAVFSKGRPPKLLGALLAETIAAQIMTMPIIMCVFGRVSLIGLVANILVVPLVPVAMSLSLIAGVFGACWPFVAGWLVWPATFLLTYMLDLVGLLSRLPHASTQRNLSLTAMACSYLILVGFIIALKRPLRSRRFLNYDKITG